MTFGGAVFLCYALPVAGNWIIDANISSAKREYKEQLNQYVENNLADWKPLKKHLSAEEYLGNSKRDIFDDIENGRLKVHFATPRDLLKDMREERIVRTFKELHPEYSDWDNTILAKQLPKLDLRQLPSEPIRFRYEHYRITEILVIASLAYFLILLARLTIWSIRYLRKSDVK